VSAFNDRYTLDPGVTSSQLVPPSTPVVKSKVTTSWLVPRLLAYFSPTTLTVPVPGIAEW
jgi:hypothetical protein